MKESTKETVITLIPVFAVVLLVVGIFAIARCNNTPYSVMQVCRNQCGSSESTDSAESLFAYECCYEACVESTETILDQDCPIK